MQAKTRAEIRAEDFPDTLRGLVEKIGIAATLEVMGELGGSQMYIAKPESVFQSVERRNRDAEIRAEFNGYNRRGLARKHGLTEEQVRRILKRHPTGR